jgi:hypothetical protein
MAVALGVCFALSTAVAFFRVIGSGGLPGRMVQMDPIVCRIDGLQNAGAPITNNDSTAAPDAVIDCVEVSADCAPSTFPVAVQFNRVQYLFCTHVESLNSDYSPFLCKGELL